ncbi:hypothetical protein BDZ89DRAFT_1049001 [Hymenopellis radicata]|nr:hypothetical protein BDZ89DRAFT_1049001 [Hymenopellis radicata]
MAFPPLTEENDEFWTAIFPTHIISLLTLYDLHIFARCCHITNRMVNHQLAIRPSLPLVLERFFNRDATPMFLQMLHSTGSILSGSGALAYFSRAFHQIRDLDIITTTEGAMPVAIFLQLWSYHLVPRTNQTLNSLSTNNLRNPNHIRPYIKPSILDVFDFQNPRGAEVQIIVSMHSPIGTVLEFHSTVVENIIEASRAISLYPRLTCQLNVNVPTNGRRIHDHIARRKYEQRGWRLIQSRIEMLRVPLELGKIRRVGDQHCWVQDFNNGLHTTHAAHTWAAWPIPRMVKLHYSNFRHDDMQHSYCVDAAILRWARCPLMHW